MSSTPSKLTVPELKAQLAERGLPRTGRKADLVARLIEAGAGSAAGPSAAEPPKKKAKAGVGAKDKTCVASCRPGPKSGCPTRGRGKPAGHLACAEVDRRLEALGVKAGSASLCVKAAIMRGHVVVAGEDKVELEQVVHSEEGECGHTIRATLGDLLQQPDYAGLDYEDGLENATVLCKEDGCEEGRTYVTGLCEGRPSFDSGKFHNHCRACPGFGQCIHDYRNSHCDRCGKHYFSGLSGFPCDCRTRARGFGKGGFGGCHSDSDGDGPGGCDTQ